MSFFDKNPVLYPWPKILRKSGLKFTYKPREVWWKHWIEKLNLKPDEKVLEVGCGRGIFLDRLVKEYNVKTSGIDIASLAIKDAEKECIYNHDLHAGDACKLPFKNETFDVVLTFDTLEHIKNRDQAVLEMIRVLKKNGKILLFTINKNQFLTWDWLISKSGIDIYSKLDHDPKLFVNPKDLSKQLIEQRINIKSISYFDSFFSLIADESVMVFLIFWKKLFGWKRTEKSATLILGSLSAFSVLLSPVLRVLDLPWTILGLSNGFLILGQKE